MWLVVVGTLSLSLSLVFVIVAAMELASIQLPDLIKLIERLYTAYSTVCDDELASPRLALPHSSPLNTSTISRRKGDVCLFVCVRLY